MSDKDIKNTYQNVVKSSLIKKFGYKSPMAVPKITKVSLNMGLGEAVSNKKVLEHAISDMSLIAGQKPLATMARKSIAGFKIRDGWPIGCKVTLRKKNMYSFLNRLIHVALPRVRDFRGLSPKSFDSNGNFSFGVEEQIIFPEINYDKIDTIRGFDVTVCTTAKTKEEALSLLTELGFPFRLK